MAHIYVYRCWNHLIFQWNILNKIANSKSNIKKSINEKGFMHGEALLNIYLLSMSLIVYSQWRGHFLLYPGSMGVCILRSNLAVQHLGTNIENSKVRITLLPLFPTSGVSRWIFLIVLLIFLPPLTLFLILILFYMYAYFPNL